MSQSVTTEPSLADMLRRLIETPEDFLAVPHMTGATAPGVRVDAVVSDVLVVVGGSGISVQQAAVFRKPPSPESHNWLASALVGCWLIGYFEPIEAPKLDQTQIAALLTFLTETVGELAQLVPAEQLVADPERREELARLLLHDLALVPRGETPIQAQDRLATLDSVNRARIMEQARDAEQRAEEVRLALESKRAAEAAAKASRE